MENNIKVKDNGEKLVDIKKYCPKVKISIGKKRLEAERTARLRLTVAKMLQKAQESLPRGYSLIVNDAWRPAFVQADIYFSFIKRFSKRNPLWSKKKVIEEVEKYVAPWTGEKASGHMAGGAVDVRVIDSMGHKIPMKSRKLTYQENALSEQNKLPNYMRKNRDILFSAMRQGGFSNYPKEYWHWSYGDLYWARRNKKSSTFYGPVADDNGLYKNKDCPCMSGRKFDECHGQVL